MNLRALKTIGEVVLERQYSGDYKYGTFTTPGTLVDERVTHAFCLQYRVIGDDNNTSVLEPQTVTGFEFQGAEWREIDDNRLAAEIHQYAHKDQAHDHSLSQRVTGNDYTQRFFDERYSSDIQSWTSDAVEENPSDPFLSVLHDTVMNPCEGVEDALAEADQVDQEYGLLTLVFVDPDGVEYTLGEIPVVGEVTKSNIERKFSDNGAEGEGVCSLCSTEGIVYGLGATVIGNGRVLASKKQGPFPETAASEAWRSRPLCGECVQKVEKAHNGFIDEQKLRIPQTRCRIIPYSATNDTEVVKNFVRSFLFELPSSDNELDEDELSDMREQALFKAITTAGTGGVGSLRFFVWFYQQDKSKMHGIHSISGVSFPTIDRIQSSFTLVEEENPIAESGVQDAVMYEDTQTIPSDKQLVTGRWFYDVFSSTQNQNGNGDPTPDPGSWREIVENVLTNRAVEYDVLVKEIAREMELNRDEEYEFGAFHGEKFIRAHYVFAALDDAGLLTGVRSNSRDNSDNSTHDDETSYQYPTMQGLDNTYETYGDAVESIIEQNEALRDSPGRGMAFTLGVLAARLSNWQSRRGNSRTFIDANGLTQLSPETAAEWMTRIWEKSTTYNQQENNSGVPWQGIHQVFHTTQTQYENSETPISVEEFRYYYVAGVNLNQALTVEDYDGESNASTDSGADQNIVGGEKANINDT